MKHYILLTVTIPERRTPKHDSWIGLSDRLRQTAATTKGIVTLSENAWLIPRDVGVSFLAMCVAEADTCELQHRIWWLSAAA